MFDEFTKREVALVFGLLLLGAALAVLGTVYLMNRYVLDRRNDPLSKAPSIQIEQKK